MSKLSLNRIISTTALIASLTFTQNIDEAVKLFNAFQFDKAKEIFHKLADDVNNPRIAEVYYYLGRLAIMPDSAIYYYKIVIDKYPQSRYADVAYLEVAKISIMKESFEDALVVLNELARNYPNSEIKDEILFWTGVAFIESGNRESGHKKLQELVNNYPNSIWASRAKNLLPSNLPPKEYYTIQIGSYRNKENADKRVDELKTKGIEGRIVEAIVMDKIHYRVWVGEFATREQAKSVLLRLDSLGIKGNVVKGY